LPRELLPRLARNKILLPVSGILSMPQPCQAGLQGVQLHELL